ncbi:carboxypeptidase-like regulatory domain-containing protein [Bacteroides oleiciplenus]|uniref:carboxypeptidase-like regulatory domain-containing protein n=1 Tax=Bacteroides oleiciplenus TaxID=626931 RepID=UPI0026DD6872|nr:carboxypeptidase-like regulatory domain-containing protein [Bacteroides oleiciplenus]
MRIYVFLFLIAICTFSLKSQTQGEVIDGKSNYPLFGVNIYMQKDSVGIGVTDETGHFSVIDIEKFVENDTIVFSYVGYLSLKLTLKDLQYLGYQVLMYSYSQQLPEVSIKGERGRIFLDYAPLKDLPKAVCSSGSFVQDNKIYIISGDEITPTVSGFLSKKMLIYDIASDTWTESLQKFTRRTGHRAHYYKGKVFVIGGKYNSINHKLEYTVPQIEIYDLDKDTLYVDWVNPHQAVDPATFIYDDCLYVMGGTVKKNKFSSKVHMLDLKTGVWYDTGIIIPKERRDFMKCVLIGHVVYFFGGQSIASKWKVRSYDLQLEKWNDLCDLKEGVSCPGVTVNENLIYIYENTTLQTYNIRTNMVNAYYFTEGTDNSELFYADGKLYIVGGSQQDPDSSIQPENVFSVDISCISAE